MIEAAGGGHTVEVNTTISRATDFEALQMRPLPAGERQAVMALLGRHVRAIRRYFVNKVRRADDVDGLVDAVKRLMGKTSPWFGRCRRFAAHLFAVQQVVLRRYYGLCLVEASGQAVAALGAAAATWTEAAPACRRIVAGLRGLPMPQQEVLELVWWEDVSVAELAAILEVPIPLAASRLRAAKTALLAVIGPRPASTAQESAMLAGLDAWGREIGERLQAARTMAP